MPFPLTLDVAQTRYRERPTLQRAVAYLATLCEYQIDGMIGDETFVKGVRDVTGWLTRGVVGDEGP
jgi:hypothetical protein